VEYRSLLSGFCGSIGVTSVIAGLEELFRGGFGCQDFSSSLYGFTAAGYKRGTSVFVK
jgi:hypothetical protein